MPRVILVLVIALLLPAQPVPLCAQGPSPAGPETGVLAARPDPIANPLALQGGSLNLWGASFPKSLNMFLDYNSFSAEVMGLMFENLVTLHSTKNEPVGVLALSWDISPDKRTFTFRLNPEARWSDGRPVTAEDVQFYYDVMMDPKNLTSIFRVSLKRFTRPVVIDAHTIRITATEAHWENFWTAAGMVALPRHIWQQADFNRQNFEFPVVSGPYRLAEVKKNRYLVLERRRDWWGQALPYNRHKYNFDRIKYRFMEDRNKALEAFKKGECDVYAIYTSSIWARKTRFEQVLKNWVVRQEIYNEEPKGFQGFAINLRRPIFQDPRVREALCLLLNREQMNAKLMFGEYFLLNAYYPDLFPGNVNPEVPLRSYDPERARALLKEAGWTVDAGGTLIKDGQAFDISFLTYSVDNRHLNVYIEDLARVGIRARIDQLSLSSVRKRLDGHDFDLFWINWSAGRLRDPEGMWHSATADQAATNNLSGVKDPVVDELIEHQKTEMDLDARNAILRQLDLRLNAIIPYILLWQSDHHRVLYWNRFGTPRTVFDKFNREDAVITYWYLDPQKDEALRDAMATNTPLPPAPARVVYTD